MLADRLLGTLASALTGGGAAIFGALVCSAMSADDPHLLLDHLPWLMGALIALFIGGFLQLGGWIGLDRRHESSAIAPVGAVLVGGVILTNLMIRPQEPLVQLVFGAALIASLAVHAWGTSKALASALFLDRAADHLASVARISSRFSAVGLAALMLAFVQQFELPQALATSLFAIGFGGYAVGQLALAGVFARG